MLRPICQQLNAGSATAMQAYLSPRLHRSTSKESSSLCPLCRRSALPPAFCPVKIPDEIVRREHVLRERSQHLRSRQSDSQTAANDPTLTQASLEAPQNQVNTSQPISIATLQSRAVLHIHHAHRSQLPPKMDGEKSTVKHN